MAGVFNTTAAGSRLPGNPLNMTLVSHQHAPLVMHFMNLLKGNRRVSKVMVSNLSIKKGNFTFKSLIGEWKDANPAHACSNALP